MSLYFSLLVVDDRTDFVTPKSAIHGPQSACPGIMEKTGVHESLFSIMNFGKAPCSKRFQLLNESLSKIVKNIWFTKLGLF